VFYNVDGYNLGIQAKEYIIPIRKPKKWTKAEVGFELNTRKNTNKQLINKLAIVYVLCLWI
jgi:hypothetical protein